MEFKCLENSKNRMRLEFTGGDHSFFNTLKNELWNNKHVGIAGLYVEHPLIDKTIMTVETDAKITPKKALLAAAKDLMATNEKFKKEFSKAVR